MDLNLETLRDFVSPAIFKFLSSDVGVGKTMNTKNSDLTFDDHNLVGNDPPPTLDELDAHVDALLLVWSAADDTSSNRQLLNMQGWILH